VSESIAQFEVRARFNAVIDLVAPNGKANNRKNGAASAMTQSRETLAWG